MHRAFLAFCLSILVAGAGFAQDECSSAFAVVDGVNGPFSTVGATTSAGTAAPSCSASYKNDVWFTYVASFTGNHKITTDTPGGVVQGTLTNTILDVWDGASCPPTTSLACDNDSGITPAASSAIASVALVMGTTYFIRVSAFNTAADGSFYVVINPTAPANDECAGAFPLMLGTNPAPGSSGLCYSLTDSTLSGGWAAPTCDTTANNADVWFTYTATMSGLHQFDQETPGGFGAGTMTASVFDVFPASGCTPTAPIACDDDGGTIVASGGLVVANLTSGSTYYIRVTDDDTYSGGNFYVNVGFIGPAAANDECSGALPLALGTNPAPAASGNFYTIDASTFSAAWGTPTCDTSVSADVWFIFTPGATGLYQFDQETPGGFAAGTLIATVLDVFSDTGCVPAAAIGCDDDGGTVVTAGGLVTVNLTAGLNYYLRVSDDDAFSGGTFYVNVTFIGLPVVNDECSGALPLVLGTNPTPAASGNLYTTTISTLSAGWPVPTCDSVVVRDVWFTFTPPISGIYQFDQDTPAGFTAGTLTATVFDVFPGGSCTPGTSIACDDDGGVVVTSGGLVLANLTGGLPYLLRVSGDDATVNDGTFYVNVAFFGAAVSNDECSTAVPLALGTSFHSNIGATTSLGWPALATCPTATAAIMLDVWFSYTPTSTGVYQFQTTIPCGATAPTMTNPTIALYDGSAGTCGAPYAHMVCDGDSGPLSQSWLKATLTASTTYFLRVGPTTSTGTAAVNATFYVTVTQGDIVNDTCATASPISVGTNPAPAASCFVYSTVGATDTVGAACATIAKDLWFSFVPPTTENYIIDTNTPCGFSPASANTTVALYTGACPGGLLVCDADTGKGTLSALSVGLVMGTPYLIRVGVSSTTGEGTFYLNVNPGTVGTNDECGSAIPVVLGTNPSPSGSCVTYTNTFATTSAGTVCATINNDLWFAFTPPHDGNYVIDTETPIGSTDGTMTDSVVAVYDSCGGTLLGCDDDSGVTNGGLNSIVTVSLTGGAPVLIRVGSFSTTSEGTFYLNITESFSLWFTSNPCAPGLVDISLNIAKGPPSGSYFICITGNAGAFPNGWFFGIDPLMSEVLEQAGAPLFTGPLDVNGNLTLGPLCGLPTGVLTLYSVALGFATPFISIPIAFSAPTSIAL